MQQEVLVRPDGGFSYPLAGDIQAQGKSVAELRDEIARNLQRYIPDPVVTVAVKSIEGNRIYVIGKVHRAGEFLINRDVNVMQALSMAGGLTPFADTDSIKILRRAPSQEVVFRFNYDEVEAGSALQQNIVLKSGDVVVVP